MVPGIHRQLQDDIVHFGFWFSKLWGPRTTWPPAALLSCHSPVSQQLQSHLGLSCLTEEVAEVGRGGIMTLTQGVPVAEGSQLLLH